MRIMFWDIECSPMLAYIWSRKTRFVRKSQIFKDWQILCASWCYNDERSIYSAVSDKGCDKNVVSALYKAMDNVDVLVHHNGDSYDFKRLQTRGAKHGFGPPRKPYTVDTLKQARRVFGLTSNSLDDIADYFGLPRKAQVEEDIFFSCANGDAAALEKLLKYNKQDVKVQREIFNRLKPHLNIPHIRLFHNLPEGVCPRCASPNTIRNGYKYTLSGKFQAFQCKTCATKFQSTKAEKKVQEK